MKYLLQLVWLLIGLLGAQTAQAAGGCSTFYKGQVYLNEISIGASRSASASNKVELFNKNNVAQSVWQSWSIAVYYSTKTNGTSITSYSYKLNSGFTASGQFIYNSSSTSPKIYMRNRNAKYLVVALLDQNGDFIDYVALDNTITKVPACMGTTTVDATAGSDLIGFVGRTTDGGAWPAAVTNTGANTIGRTNVCSAGVNDLVVTSTVDVSAPTINVTPLTYLVTVLNKSCTASIASVKLTDTNITTTNFSSLAFATTAGSITAPSASTPLWTIGTLAAGTSASLTITGTPTVLGTITSVAAVTALGTTLSNTSDDSASQTISVHDYNYVGFDLSSDTVTEGFDTTYTVNISSDIPPASGKPITVSYTVSGTADSGDTNLAASGTITIDPLDAAGDPNTSGSLTFTIKDDLIYEPTKTIIFTITGAVSADNTARSDPSTNSMTITLLDNDTSCVTDTFASGTLNTALWNVAGIGFTPMVMTSPTVASNRLRLTDNAGNRSAYAQLKKWIPSASNKVVVEFDYFAWAGSGNGGDGLAVVFSDASVSPSAGGYGGSLGYANRSGSDGFGGGWLAIGLDEFGNFPGTGEGRRDYPSGYTPPVGANVAASYAANSIAVRGSGSGQNAGYALLANSGTLASGVKTGTTATDSTTKHRYRITIDHSNSINAYVMVERDTTGAGTNYATVIPSFDVRVATAGQATVPTNLLLSFTSGTGGATNNHEVSNLKICATKITDVGAAAPAANFECMDDFLTETNYNNLQTSPALRNPIYTKLAKTAFKLRVVPLDSAGAVKSDYIPAGGSSKDVTVEIFDDSTTPRHACNAYQASDLIATQTATLASGLMTTGSITINKAYTKLMCRVTDNAVPATPVQGCSSDQFSVRPGNVTLTPSVSMATPPSASASPTLKAGATFTLRATTSTSSTDAYSGILSQNSAAITAQTTTQDTTQVSGGVVGTLALTPVTVPSNSLTANAAASSATYSEVGYLYLAAGAFRDTTYTAVDGTSDCVSGSTSVTLSSGKYGCAIGNTVALTLGRFVPDRFTVTTGTTAPACSVINGFTYFAQTDGFATPFQLKAVNSIGAGSTTQNYTGVFAKLGNGGWVWSGTSSATGLRFGTSTALPGGAVLAVATSGGVDVVPAGTWANGAVSLSNVKHQISRPTALAGETAVTVTTFPIDSDGVTTTAATPVSGATALRYGRIRMLNTYGSEKLPLSVPIQAQYYDATVSGFKPNTDDSCTPVSVPTARTLSASPPTDGVASRSFYPLVTGANQLSSTDTTASMGTTLASGVANMAFTAPGKRGWLDIILTVPDHLKANWGNCWGQSGTAGLMDDLPCARATFGVYKSPLLYRRENY